jgi:hypothetical protein
MRRLVLWVGVVTGCTFSPLPADELPVDTPSSGCAGAGHDEDGDGIDDNCDNCPGVADETFADGDGDQIGDACDPHPGEAIDHLRDFISFAESGASTRWEVLVTTAWSWSADELRFDDVCCEYHVVRDAMAPFALPVVVDARFVVTAPPAERGHLGLLANVNGSGNGGIACAVVRDPNLDSKLFINDPDGGNSAMDLPPLAAGTAYRLKFTYDPVAQNARCELVGGPVVAITITDPPPTGPLGFEAMGLVGRVTSAAVYGY